MDKSNSATLPAISIQFTWDPVAAQRIVVVHGIHAILWALDKLVEIGTVNEEIVALKG